MHKLKRNLLESIFVLWSTNKWLAESILCIYICHDHARLSLTHTHQRLHFPSSSLACNHTHLTFIRPYHHHYKYSTHTISHRLKLQTSLLFTIITKLVSSSKSIFSQLQTHEHLKLFISLPLFQLVPVCVCVCALSTGSISKKLKISNNVYSHPQQSAILLLTWSTIVFLLINTLFELYLVSWSFQSERDMQYDFWNVYRSGLL